MKFKFCGEQDCPDWILAEMAIISKLSSVRVRLLTKQLFIHLIDNTPLVYEKLHKFASSSRVVLDDLELKAIINTIYFIITNAARFNIDAHILYPELEQLGLPSDVSKSLSKMYMTYQHQLATKLISQTLKLNTLGSIQWRVNYIVDSSISTNTATSTTTATPEARIVLDIQPSQSTLKLTSSLNQSKLSSTSTHLSTKSQPIIFDASIDTLDLLLHELEECQNIFASLNGNNNNNNNNPQQSNITTE